jgi:hypothetical protein
MILICLTGAARSGKDSVADRLVERHGFAKISFAAPLKQALRATDPILGFHPYKPGELVRLSEALANETEDAIKSDAVFSHLYNVAEAWHVVRPSLVGPVGEQHASAVLHGNLGEDREVLNDGSLDDLHSIVDAIIEDLEDAQ